MTMAASSNKRKSKNYNSLLLINEKPKKTTEIAPHYPIIFKIDCLYHLPKNIDVMKSINHNKGESSTSKNVLKTPRLEKS